MKIINAILASMVVCCHANSFAARHLSDAFNKALTKGADARLCLNVCDETGVPVADAKIRVTLANSTSDYSVYGITDTKGIYVINGNTTGNYLKFKVSKAGYYDSWNCISYIKMGCEHEVKDGKWQPYGERFSIVLRRVQNPVAVKIGKGEFALTKHLNQWLGFDLQKHDFVHPYGIGDVADFEVMIEWNGKWLPDYTGMGVRIRFTVPCSGYYEQPIFSASRFKGPYSADTGKTFNTVATFDEQVVSPTKRIQHSFDSNKCWVVRSRCKVDEERNLISANYSVVHKIGFCGEPDGRGGVRITGAFNPTPNDTNLEPKP